LCFIIEDSVLKTKVENIRSDIGENQMLSGRLQRFFVAMAYYCVMAGLLSILAHAESAFAQSAPPTESIERLIDNLEELGGTAGKLGGQLGVGSVVDSARSDAVEGFARSPFSRSDGSDHPELDTKFKVGELLLIEKYCRGETTKSENLVLRVMKEFSGIERDYCSRSRDRILQIGYEVFDGVLAPDVLINGTIGDDYILGIGDELVLSYEGKKTDSITIHIDREGRLIHKDIGRIPAAGRTFAQLRDDLKRQIESTQFGTEVFLSMGAVRLISVRVTGEVRSPGLKQLTGLSTIIDAISLAGGIRKTGSLRRVQVLRGDTIFWLDIYELMYTQFGGQNLAIRDGDQILVPAIGATIAVSGDVKRPGIFELGEGRKNITVQEAVELAGGNIRSKGNSLIIKSFDAEGRETFRKLNGNQSILDDGDILVVKRQNFASLGTVSISGAVTNPGVKSLATVSTVRMLVQQDNSFRQNPYLLLAALETTDPATRSRRLFPLNLQEIIDGKKDFSLRDKDHLFVFNQNEIRYLSSDEVRRIIAKTNDPIENSGLLTEESNRKTQIRTLNSLVLAQVGKESGIPGAANGNVSTASPTSEKIESTVGNINYSCLGLRNLATILQFTRSTRFASVVQALGGTDNLAFVNPRKCPAIFDTKPDLLPFLLEHAVAVNGEVRMPGAYPVTTGTPVSSLLANVGGMTLDADTRLIELSRFSDGSVSRQNYDFTKVSMASVNVNPGDVARFNSRFQSRDSGPVLLSGEFVRPGLYDIRRGERLSEVFARAGGVTGQAYPYGAVFTRERVRVAERAAFKRAARELKSAAMYAGSRDNANLGSLAALQDLTDEISNTESVGRVVIEADPTVLQVRPELDSVLEPGDRIFMPKRPNSVLVIGDILNPGALQFISGTKVDEYVQQAGGLQVSADEDRMFLVYPNGVAQPISISVWNYNPVQVPPGSTVVVPKDPVPINVFDFAKDMTVLLSQMAITAASLAVIGNN
jgi:polysaccharide biosynthesis/export protein